MCVFRKMCVALLAMAMSVGLMAQDAHKLMTFEVRALANEMATSYVATFYVVQAGATSEEAERALKTRLKPFLAGLNRLEGVTAQVEFGALVPVYKALRSKAKKGVEAELLGEELTGFELGQWVYVSYISQSQLGEVMGLGAKQGIYEVLDVQVRHNGGERVFQNLRAKCLEYMRQHLPQLEDQGFDVLDWERFLVEERRVHYPAATRRAVSVQKETPVAVEGALGVVVKREATQVALPQFLPTEGYQILVNGQMLAPALQFEYVMKVQMLVPQELPKIEYKNEFIMPTPAPSKPQPAYVPLPPVAPVE